MTWETAAAVAALPALALWAAYPRRSVAAGIMFGLALAAGAALVAAAPASGRAAAALTALWSAGGCALAWRLARRREEEHAVLLERLSGVRAQRERMAEELRGLKARGMNAELAHREASALYGMVKSLSEALSWDDARPRVEAALEQYFGPRVEYALYVAGLRGEGRSGRSPCAACGRRPGRPGRRSSGCCRSRAPRRAPSSARSEPSSCRSARGPRCSATCTRACRRASRRTRGWPRPSPSCPSSASLSGG
ncbi:MAG: hypothetical protein M0D55_14655 [Elusimicrobiota bacterium]|nr:MAG: hypothetical protein M0D55_14655 [Elusimicrobiota bacterium]